MASVTSTVEIVPIEALTVQQAAQSEAAAGTVPALLQLESGESVRMRVELVAVHSASELRHAVMSAAADAGAKFPPGATFEILRADGTPEVVTAYTAVTAMQRARALTVFRSTRAAQQAAATAPPPTTSQRAVDCGYDGQTCCCHALLCMSTLGLWTPCWVSYCVCKDRTGACCERPQDVCLKGESSNRSADEQFGQRFGLSDEDRVNTQRMKKG